MVEPVSERQFEERTEGSGREGKHEKTRSPDSRRYWAPDETEDGVTAQTTLEKIFSTFGNDIPLWDTYS